MGNFCKFFDRRGKRPHYSLTSNMESLIVIAQKVYAIFDKIIRRNEGINSEIRNALLIDL